MRLLRCKNFWYNSLVIFIPGYLIRYGIYVFNDTNVFKDFNSLQSISYYTGMALHISMVRGLIPIKSEHCSVIKVDVNSSGIGGGSGVNCKPETQKSTANIYIIDICASHATPTPINATDLYISLAIRIYIDCFDTLLAMPICIADLKIIYISAS